MAGQKGVEDNNIHRYTVKHKQNKYVADRQKDILTDRHCVDRHLDCQTSY